MNKRIISWYIGVSLMLLSALMTISCIIACFNDEDNSRTPLFVSAVYTGLAGIFPLLFVRRQKHKLNFREGNCIVVGSWVAACLFGMLPFLFYGHEFTFLNAMFESVSGFTTTGASILKDIEALPKGLLFWRISTAWVGGIGIVTLFSMIMSSEKSTLSRAEISNVAQETFSGQRSTFFVNRMLVTYLAITLITSLALRITGLKWFDAITCAMSACSTCGFCTKNASIAAFQNPAAEIVLIFAMLAAALNFVILFTAVSRRRLSVLRQSETTRVFLTLVTITIVIIALNLRLSGSHSSIWVALRDAAFQVASISTTTGFATQDTTQWPALSMALIFMCSFICGCSGSTSGGIKMDRAILATKGIKRRIALTISPFRVQKIKIDNRVRPDSRINDAFIFIFCYLALTIVFAFINVSAGMDFTSGVSASVACIGNVGPGLGEVGSMGNYAEIPSFIKITSMIEMLIGRLEIFPVLYLFNR